MLEIQFELQYDPVMVVAIPQVATVRQWTSTAEALTLATGIAPDRIEKACGAANGGPVVLKPIRCRSCDRTGIMTAALPYGTVNLVFSLDDGSQSHLQWDQGEFVAQFAGPRRPRLESEIALAGKISPLGELHIAKNAAPEELQWSWRSVGQAINLLFKDPECTSLPWSNKLAVNIDRSAACSNIARSIENL